MENLQSVYKGYFKKALQKNPIYRESSDPYEIISNFFDTASIEDHLLLLKRVYKNAISPKSFNRDIADVLYRYKLISQLLNAAWVIYKADVKFSKSIGLVGKHKSKGKVLSDAELTVYLKSDEIVNPYLVFERLYRELSLYKLQDQLYEMLNLSLCSNEHAEEQLKIRKVYKSLVKVLIGCWLIFKNEIASNHITETVMEPVKENEDCGSFTSVSDALNTLFKTRSPVKLSMSLRKMLVDYMLYNANGLPVDFEEVVGDYYRLNNFLDHVINNGNEN
ncbi:hypothetical protein [Pedobacter sp.]|uniref:hypothetical protein n=1 Tax=Pedobacter sp. TaxID=1411316 RepID=UPI00396C7AAB